MRRAIYRSHGGPDVIEIEELALPVPGPGQALVRVAAAGVNFFDTQARSGLYARPLPAVLGTEGAGTVEAVGPDVTEVAPGDRVVWILAPGSYASHVVVPIARIALLPDFIDFGAAAATFYQALTAHYLGCSTYPLKEGDVALVHSGAGGVGMLLTQIAKIRGATVISTVSSPSKVDAARDAGADHVIVYTGEDFAARASDLTGGRGVDVVYDAVGLETYEKSMEALRPRGMLVLYGEASGVVPPFDVRKLLAAGSIYVTRTGLDSYITNRAELLERADEVFAWMKDGGLRQTIGARYSLDETAKAHTALESRASIGKILLAP
ncbi:quinone oxidoreductase family protein [Pelagibacterium lacus]|uniref:Quinone oxidoreductase n=1 Tax=Pelagibacterium lacus TaxID=2282655 RepID=A0A369W9P7_9HYPH|nr:quinone oxidoreductase [Pelagibacterium lacus]RDE10080.1 quinone oxidoreductase [Pelagibacterium lacus]